MKEKRLAPTLHTIKKLYSLSSNKCAFKDCDERLFNEAGARGEICHIEAALSNGPRFNINSDPDERRSFHNLILLCANHHKAIDSPENLHIYTTSELRKIKENHESLSIKTSVTLNDAQYELLIENYLKKQESQLNLIESLLTKLYLFKRTLDYFEINQAYLPSVGLFRNQLFFETENEKLQTENIIRGLKSGDKIGLIEGFPACGKTTTALNIAIQFEANDTSTYYCSISSNISKKDILSDINIIKNQTALLIIDEVQSNVSLASDIYIELQSLKQLSVLFISRHIGTEFQENENGLNIFKEITNKLLLKNGNQSLKSKFKGIINSFKRAHTILNEIGNLNTVISNCNSNLLKLSLTLKEWKESNKSLDKIDKLSLNQAIYRKYLSQFSRNELEIILESSVLFSFGIEFHLIENINLKEKLGQAGLIIEVNYTQHLFRFGHSDFSELICDAIIQNDSSKEINRYREFPKSQFKAIIIESYLNKFPVNSPLGFKYPKNLISLFIKLGQEKQKSIIDFLWTNKSIKDLTIAYITSEIIQGKELRDFLRILIYKSKENITFFFERIFNPRDNISLKLGESGFDFFGLLIGLSINNDPKAPIESLLNQIDTQTIKQLLVTGRLSSITFCCRLIGKHNRGFALKIINQLSLDEWVHKFQSEPLFVITVSLIEIKSLNQTLASDILLRLNPASLVEKGQSSKLLHLEKSLSELKEFNLELCKEILSKYPKGKLGNELGQLSASKTGRTLNNLSKINFNEVQSIFNSLNSTELAENLLQEPITNSFRAIEEMRYVSPEKTSEITTILLKNDISKRIRTSEDLYTLIHTLTNLKHPDSNSFINSISKSRLTEILNKSSVDKFASTLAAIVLLDSKLAKELFSMKQIDLSDGTNFSSWGLILNKLRKIDSDGVKDIATRVNVDKSVANITRSTMTFVTISQVLSELQPINSSLAKDLLEKLLITDEFKLKIKRENIDSFLDGLRLCNKVDKSKTQTIWNDYKTISKDKISNQQIDVLKFCSGLNKIRQFGAGIIPGLIDIFWNQLRSKILGVKFNELMHSLSDLHNVAPKRAKILLDLCSIDHLKRKALEIPKDKLGNALGELKKIDNEKYLKLNSELTQ